MPSSPSTPVATYTPRAPYSVGPKEPLGNARRLMEKYSIHQLPVRTEGKLVGLLAERELRLLWKLAQPAPETLTVEQAMSSDPFTVTSDTALDEVVRLMVQRDVDSAVVVDEGGRVVGVFTATNAMEALVEMAEPKRTRADERGRAAQPRRPARGRETR